MRAVIALLIVLAGLPLAIGQAGAGRVNEEDRQTFKAFRDSNKMAKADFDRLYGATARIECRFKGQPVWASGSIVHQSHLFVTADHVFVEINGELSGPETSCRVITLFDGRRYRIRAGSVQHGFLRAGVNGRGLKNDWAVGQLTEPTRVERPFPLPPEGAVLSEGDKVILMTQGHRGWGAKRPSIGRCKVMANILGLYVTTDCDADKGASGGPLLEWGKAGEQEDGPFIAGILISIVERGDDKDKKTYGDLSATIANPISSTIREAILRAGIPKPRRRPWILKDLAFWDAKLAADPADPTARLNHGLVLIAMGDSEDGEKELLEGLARDGKAEPRLVTAAIAVLGQEFAADNKAYPALRVRAELYRARGDVKRAVLERERYRRAVRQGIPPLADREWEKLGWRFRSGIVPEYRAVAVPETDHSNSWLVSSDTSAWEAAHEALRICRARFRKPCRIYALGRNVVWLPDGDELDERIRAYQSDHRASLAQRIDDLSKGPERDRSGPLVERGRLALVLGNAHDAAEALDRAVRAGFTTPDIRLDLGRAFLMDGRFARAVGALEPLARDVFHHAARYRAAWLRGQANLALGRLDAASRDAEWMIRAGQGIRPDGFVLRAGVAFARDKRSEAMAGIGKAVLLGSGKPDMRTAICRLLATYAQPGAAREHCELAGRMRPMNAETLDAGAFVLWQLGDAAGAKKLLGDARLVRPGGPETDDRFEQFRVELAATFLSMKGFYRGPRVVEATGALGKAIQAFQAANGLEPTGEPDDRLLGRLTPLGFGDTRLEQVPGLLTADAIRKGCRKVLRGEEVRIPVAGALYRCNSDARSVRRIL